MANPRRKQFTQTSSSDDQPSGSTKHIVIDLRPRPEAGPGRTVEAWHNSAMSSQDYQPGIMIQQAGPNTMMEPILRSPHDFPQYWEDDWIEMFPTFQGPNRFVETPSSAPRTLYFWENVWTERRIKAHAWQKMICQYKTSVKCRHDNVSLASQYTEPVITLKNKKGGFRKISVEELFHIPHLFYPPIILLQGNSGSGKSFIAQKIMLDWASEKHYLKDFDLAFYLRCEELMCLSEEMNLIELLSWNCSFSSDQISQMLQNSAQRVLIIIDGLDDLDDLRFMCHEFCISSNLERAPPEVIFCSLLQKQILPRSFLLITTRTEVPQGMLCIGQHRFFKIVGFCEKGVEEYFQKFFQDEELFRKAFKYLKANKSLFTFCSFPVICWIICTVMRERFNDGADVRSGLETTTSIYTDFVSTLLEHHCQGLSQSVLTMLRSLGQLAEKGMLEQQVLFDEKNMNETISDLTGSPFMCKFLSRRRIHQETMFSFMHRSFQEFFTALYYVLLDEEESQRKVRELLHTVERGWALSCWSDRDFSVAGLKTRHSKLLQPVILFLCGLCKTEWIPSFFKKHNMAVSVNIETQLKEWIDTCSQRYQNEHMLFILCCLYELHDKSFVGKVLEHLSSIDLSNIPLKNSDCWMLQFCLQNCVNISNLRLNITSENLKILQSALYSCKQLWLKVDHITDDTGDLISALAEGKIMKELIIQDQKGSKSLKKQAKSIIASVENEDLMLSVCCSKMRPSSLISEFTLTCSRQEISTVNWRIFLQKLCRSTGSQASSVDEFFVLDVLQSVSGLKKVHMQTDRWTVKWNPTILSLVQAFPSLNELRINATISLNPLKIIQSLRESLTQTGWTLTVWRKSVLIERDGKSFTVSQLRTIKTENIESKRAESLSGQTSSDDAEVFTPDHVQEDDEDKHKNTYRFVCPHAGQFRCSLTNLVFVMEGEGEVLYKTVSWDPRLLDGLGQMKSAGPLYNIDCFHGSISRLHLPHCEISEENKDGLAVAHLTGGNTAIMQPLQVTETHVMIDIRDLSIFGLIKRMIFPPSPVAAQVLVFLRPITLRQRENILDVHLLPWNIPLSEVKDQHTENTHIKTSSKCSLTPATEYSLCCQPEESTVQPETEMFECNFGPNYHPTFEVFVNVNIEEVKLSLLDKTEGKEVWLPRRILLTASGKDAVPTAHKRLTESEFVKKHRDKLIKRVSSVMAIADGLRTKDMISDEMYREVCEAKTQNKKIRILFKVLDSGGPSVKTEFYGLLKDEEPYLVDDLESGHSGQQ
ncbi:NACHT, LRR and PYD domains-containing protein 1 homolog isoform X3 [Ctenopharyngodon idella]|uniref:NACHT, LRR and PYD domains-containing protein 1 homolog isoform X3 n=1 Tax=Ctenopharyngodon idella TaxID=7959 RepID=UPI00222E192D|nr:NACHT, LRR and PYD domains-containing protein 1 homolog isoform X3 [Ctenopharyngodon idella]